MRGKLVWVALICSTVLLGGCSRKDELQLTKLQAEAEAARAEAVAAKSELAKVKADLEAERVEARAARAELVKLSSAPAPKPAVSDESRNRIIALLEKGAKHRVSTDQGIAYTPFKDQLAEVKSASETITLVGWPATWQAEQNTFEVAVDAWSLGQQIWETKLGLDSQPYDKFLFALNAYGKYGDKLNALSALVAKRSGDKSASTKLQAILKQDGGKPSILADEAIQWCFVAASLAFDKCRDGLRNRLKQ